MRILILGGGVFLGAAALRVALDRGHEVRVLNRGRARSVWPTGVRVLTGDRGVDVAALLRRAPQGPRSWDAVIPAATVRKTFGPAPGP